MSLFSFVANINGFFEIPTPPPPPPPIPGPVYFDPPLLIRHLRVPKTLRIEDYYKCAHILIMDVPHSFLF